MVPNRLSEDLASSSHSHSPCFGSSSEVKNGLREPADCQSASLAFWYLREAVAQVDRDPSARQMLQLFLSMLRQRATYGPLLITIEKLMDRIDAHPLIRTWSLPPTPLSHRK